MISPATAGWDAGTVGLNINGPSLVRVPEWVANPLGRYYLYFAHHQGDSIRLAHAPRPTGPYTIHPEGVMHLAQTPFTHHIASPDLHFDHGRRQWILYFHGDPSLDPQNPWTQSSMRAVSEDGLRWTCENVELGESYFRVFHHDGQYHAIAKGGLLYRSRDGRGRFEVRHGQLLVDGGPGRHWAVLKEGDRLRVWFSRFFDAPEHILEGEIDLTKPWRFWQVEAIRSLLKPEHDWEGVLQPVRPSRVGAVHEPVHELRDPAVFRDADGSLHLLYSTAGESGIAITRIE
ncbi:MAG: hypothetical protein EA425_10735 [Puniceicoccaceae bacterium]|nr:MAG: hypothetical protein EA425_10735 [Puniceicoccaceae bacterium]